MKFNVSDYQIGSKDKLRLSERPTSVERIYEDAADYEALLGKQITAIAEMQQALYAGRGEALLVIFQALDAAGKDGTIRHVFSGVNPQGCQVRSFRQPSEEELSHDFLWRTTVALPPRGIIGVFNRSYYEEALVVRVHPTLLPAEGAAIEEHNSFWKHRFESIRDHERHLTRNGVKIVKIFLHISREEQRRRFLARITDPDKTWKLSASDMAERASWDDYVDAYESCIGATSTAKAPWYVIPADDKRNARLIVARLVREALQSLKPKFPRASEVIQKSLDTYRQQLEANE